MNCYPFYLPSDAQIDRLLLNSASSGRLSPKDLDMLVSYIRVMRHKNSQRDYYIIPKGKTGNWCFRSVSVRPNLDGVSDAQIDQLLLDSAASGRLSPDCQDMLLRYICAMRMKVSSMGIIAPSNTKPAIGINALEAPEQIFHREQISWIAFSNLPRD